MEYRYEPRKPENTPPPPTSDDPPAGVPAREAGAIAARVLAVLIALEGVGFGTSIAQSYIQTPQRPSSTQVSPFLLQGIPAAVMLILALALWFGARRFWPSDVPVESTMGIRDWRRIAFLAIGAYVAIEAAPSALLELFSPMLPLDVFPRRVPNWRIIADVSRLALGLILVIVNYRVPIEEA